MPSLSYEKGYEDFEQGWESPPIEFDPVQKGEWHSGWYQAQLDADANARNSGEIYYLMSPVDTITNYKQWAIEGNQEGYSSAALAKEEGFELDIENLAVFKFVSLV